MKRIYIIASCTDGAGLEVETAFTPETAVKRISEMLDEEFNYHTNPNDNPIDLLERYYDWSAEDNDNIVSTEVVLEIIEVD